MRTEAQRAAKAAYDVAYRAANRDRRRLIDAEWRARQSEAQRAAKAAYAHARRVQDQEKVRAEGRAAQAAYKARNPEKVRAATAAWAVNHPEERRDYQRAYRLATPEPHRQGQHKRRVRLRGGFVEKVDLAVLVERDGGCCGICHKPVVEAERSIDHVLPVSKGGAHSYANVRLAHLSCNLQRGNRGAAQLRLVG